MKTFLANLRGVAVAGFFSLLPGRQDSSLRECSGQTHDCWQPAFVVEQDGDGNSVVFIPSAPNTNVGSVLLAKRDQVRFMPSITASQLEAMLKSMWKGLLSVGSII